MSAMSPLTSGVQLRVARVADPSIDLETKIKHANELREILEGVREVDLAPSFPVLIPTIVQLLRSTQPSFRRDSHEHQLRRVLLEIIHKIPSGDSLRPFAPAIMSCVLYLMKNDNEDLSVASAKIVMDYVRTFKSLNEEMIAEITSIFQQLFSNAQVVLEECLAEDSSVLDPNTMFPALRSFKLLSELGTLMAVLVSVNRTATFGHLQETAASALKTIRIEAPAQKAAKEDYEAMGGVWAGMAPTIKNVGVYYDFINAQIRVISYLTFVMRLSTENNAQTYEDLVLGAFQVLQNLPNHALSLRKEFLVVFRHLLGSQHRKAILPKIDQLLDERVLLGTSIASKEMFRSWVYTTTSDLLHNIKNELSAPQLLHLIRFHSKLLHDPSCGANNLHMAFAKLLFNISDVIIAKLDNPAQVLEALLESGLTRLEALVIVQEEVRSSVEKNKTAQKAREAQNAESGQNEHTEQNGQNVQSQQSEQSEQTGQTGQNTPPAVVDVLFIEKMRPVGGAPYATEKPEEMMQESRQLFRALMHGFRSTLVALKKIDAPTPDGTLIFRLFESCIKCSSLFDTDARPPNEPNDVIEWFTAILVETNLHVFQEVWSNKIEFFFEHAQKRITLLNVCQILFGHADTSSTLLAIVLKFLVDRLPMLGEYDDLRAAATIRLFKVAFNSVGLYPDSNEPILAHHLAKLLMDCFPLAAKATKPTHYFHLLRALFRAIGGGGGRFEKLYKEVLPLLPEMLECLNRQLMASEGSTRELVVELCLTVPLRLTHLLPHLSYLMRPLALALRGNNELVIQGLRTLELCIDNLTPDFLDPTLNVVLRELMEALHDHLKPLPANHHISHTTLRILGKLGGRNRTLLDKPPLLEYHDFIDEPTIPISFNGMTKQVAFKPMFDLAHQSLKEGPGAEVAHAYALLESSLSSILHEGKQSVDFVTKCVEGIFDAALLPSVQEQATVFLHQLARGIFAAEFRRIQTSDKGTIINANSTFSAFLDAWPYALSREQAEKAARSKNLVMSLIQDLLDVAQEGKATLPEYVPLLHQITNRFLILCLDDSWARKSAGCNGIKIMLEMPQVGKTWVKSRDVELVRTLLHIIKDLPPDHPHNVDEFVNVLKDVLRTSAADLDVESGSSAGMQRIVGFVGVFLQDLPSSNAVVRDVAQSCIALLVEISRKPHADLMMQYRDRMLGNIYAKPLRALPFPIQIGMIEAIRYCVSLNPPIVELSEELVRLLHEAVALADAEDNAFPGRGNLRQNANDIMKLRVASIRLLTAAMPLTDFFSKHAQTRQRITQVYFKSLYSPSKEVKDVAHEGLRMVLTHQSRLPKELLQTGLRPILMNLADPKRLSVPGLEALARLLELLTSYFKVEIGHKLLDHFKIVADPQMLQNAPKQPLGESEGITKLVRLANIFHLLPSTANIFLENLVNAIVQAETHMHFSGPSPFSEPLGKYLDRYPDDGVDFFLRHMQFPRHLRTFRSILQAKLAPNLYRVLCSRTPHIINQCLTSDDLTMTHSALLLLNDMADISLDWLLQNDYVMDSLLETWRATTVPGEANAAVRLDVLHRMNLMISIFKAFVQNSTRIDVLFEMMTAYTADLDIDLVHLTQFLYKRVALCDDLIYQRNILVRFLTWFKATPSSWDHKTAVLRYIITPTLLVHASRSDRKGDLLDADFVEGVRKMIWQPSANESFAGAGDSFTIELLHFTTVIVQHYSLLMIHSQRSLMEWVWHHISSTEDSIVKQTGYLLCARFFSVFPAPPKFIVKTWSQLLRSPHEGRTHLRQEALSVIASTLHKSETEESGYPSWAQQARQVLAEEGLPQTMTLYHLVVKEPNLFYPVRALFIPHMVNSLSKLGLANNPNSEGKLLSVEVIRVIYDWDMRAREASSNSDGPPADDGRKLALVHKETIVSYLIRLATQVSDPQTRHAIFNRALNLLQTVVGPKGWSDVTLGLTYFSRALEATDFSKEEGLLLATLSAKVLRVIAADRDDEWYRNNAADLQRLIRKGMVSEEIAVSEPLHPICDRLLRLYPIPKEDDEPRGEMSEFHNWVSSAIGDGLRNAASYPLNTLLMLKSMVQVTPERIEPFIPSLLKLWGKFLKDHGQVPFGTQGYDNAVRLVVLILDICQISIAHLGEHRRSFHQGLNYALQTKSPVLLQYILDMARSWALGANRNDPYPAMKDRATLLQSMHVYESKGTGLFHAYLQLIYDIYTTTSLRRSDLTSRLENAFLLGCRARDTDLRERFVDLLDSSIPRSLFSRLVYISSVQSWDALADHNWIHLALHLLLGATDADISTLNERQDISSMQSDSLARPKTQSIVRPVQRLLFRHLRAAGDLWASVFAAGWTCLSRSEQTGLTVHMNNLLSREYHLKQADQRPNVIQSLLQGIHACSPPMIITPHIVKYLAKTFGAWHVGLEILTSTLENFKDDDQTIRDNIYDSLAEVYSELGEEDMFYGLSRNRCLFPETNIALAYEQNGMWEQASVAYETAQHRARSGQIAFSEPEFCLWEDQWVLSSEKLQQWEILYELAKNEGNIPQMLECAWRTKDWGEHVDEYEILIEKLPEVATPRRQVFEAFMALLKNPSASTLDKNPDFTRALEEAMQLSLRKWIALPSHLSPAHVPLLQHFQQFVELQEAVQIFASLAGTNASNLEKKSADLKMVLQAWRERLPNHHDDINIWSDLLGWRQNVFHSINRTYIPLLQGSNGSAATNTSSTYGYRGYHETAWIINRFAHVARKHQLLDACFTSLAKIYTLPNIEISEAFLKLREQARCYYQKHNDLQAGLEVINNTNLAYFSTAQKAEFFTLKGMFHAKAGRQEDANGAFGQAVQLDMHQAKAWAEWGRWNDRMFKENGDLANASNAVGCYLQAAGLYKSGKSRPLQARILWLLSLDDASLTVSRSFDQYKGEAAFWYWISLVPQLCASLSYREVKQARYLLITIARHWPQAVIFSLRTMREEMHGSRRQAQQLAQSRGGMQGGGGPSGANTSPQNADNPADGAVAPMQGVEQTQQQSQQQAPTQPGQQQPQQRPMSVSAEPPRTTWETVEEIVQMLKTAFPLLSLSIETMIEQILLKFKPTPEEDIYRHICMLYADALQHYLVKMNTADESAPLTDGAASTLLRVSQILTGDIKKEFDAAFIQSKPLHLEYMKKLREWRDKYENIMASKPRTQALDSLSHYLTEFQYNKVDEIEVPGQYAEEKDSNAGFVRIQKFAPTYENCQSNGSWWKRITIHGHDNSRTSFCIQLPCHRQSRREEKTMQILRTFNSALVRKKETRKRNLTFHIPVSVTCSTNFRFLRLDSSYLTLGDVYDRYCVKHNRRREDPIVYAGDRTKRILQELYQARNKQMQVSKNEYISMKKDIFDDVALKFAPDTILTQYMLSVMDNPSELWRMRKNFAYQMATLCFMTYFFPLAGRHPGRFQFSRSSGLIGMTDILTSHSHANVFNTSDVVPFRLTPNIQRFLGPFLVEGILTSGIFSIARGLTEPEFALDQHLCLFIREELIPWMVGHGRKYVPDAQFRHHAAAATEIIVRRAETMACKTEREQVNQGSQNPAQVTAQPVIQTIVNLISTATNPLQLAKMGELYYPWF